MSIRAALIAVLATPALFTGVASAQTEVASVTRPPALFVEGSAERLGLTRVDIQAFIVGHLAETRMTLTFGNTTGRRLAGDLYVPLPPEATVSGYALDVAGRMVDGVVVSKDEARRIFETEVRKGVDPGLVEWTRGNVFKTRVFPIPPNGSRTVMLRWVQPLESQGAGVAVGSPPGLLSAYALPLQFSDKLGELTLRVEVLQGKERPLVSGQGPLSLTFDERLVASASAKNQAVVQNLRIAVPDAGRRPVQVERAADGQTYFTIHEQVPAPRSRPPIAAGAPRRLRVLWDASLSREAADHAREIGLLTRYLAALGAPAEVELVVVRNEASAPITYQMPLDLKPLTAYLEALPYDGGTQLARLGPPPGARAVDLVLVFSDGLSTFGEDTPASLGAPTWVVSSSRTAGHDFLKRLASDNGGAFFDLVRESDEAALAQFGRPSWSLLSVVVEEGQATGLMPSAPEPQRATTHAAGVLTSQRAVLRVGWGYPGSAPAVEKRYEITSPDRRPEGLPSAAAPGGKGDVLRFAWAQKRLGELLARPDKNATAMVDLGKAHGIVTPGTSLLVLETLEQYLTHRVRPPASWPELRAQWEAQIEGQRVAKIAAESQRLEEVLAMWLEEVAWYERRFDYPPDFRYRDSSSKKMAEESERDASPRDAAPPPSPEARASRSDEAPKKKDGKSEPDSPPEPGVAMTPWDPKTPWTDALKAAAAAERERVYLEQRKKHGSAPSFYLDCADFFLKAGDEKLGLRVLSNIAELRLDDPALLRVLAHRLAQLGQLTTAATIFAEVLRLRPEEPQSHRDLALVLARRAPLQKSAAAARDDWQAALDHLAAVVRQRWDRFQGIEIIALHELNRIWVSAKAAGLGAPPLDQRFIHAMELDTRIVMTWDADATDMDLHVLEPSGEETYYGHNLSTIGAKVSRDFTQGYGPEVYAVRRAMRGTYKVKTKFYGSSAAQLIGAVTLQVDVYTNWGRANEKRQSMTLRLTEAKEDFVVGEIEF